MWKITSGIDSIFTIPQDESTVFFLEFTDGCIQLEQVPEVSSGDVAHQYSDPTPDMPNQYSDVGMQLELELPDSIYYLPWD
jgi:hypothetical protein